jgi:hypothetical protein
MFMSDVSGKAVEESRSDTARKGDAPIDPSE